MDGNQFGFLDPAMYLYGMGYAAVVMMGGAAIAAALRSVKGLSVPLSVAAAIFLYGWLTEASFAGF